VEPVKARPGAAVSVAGGERETSKRRIREELSTEAVDALADSPVVAVKPLRIAVGAEPRGGVVLADECDQPKGMESHE
jgi:hypothetical protein